MGSWAGGWRPGCGRRRTNRLDNRQNRSCLRHSGNHSVQHRFRDCLDGYLTDDVTDDGNSRDYVVRCFDCRLDRPDNGFKDGFNDRRHHRLNCSNSVCNRLHGGLHQRLSHRLQAGVGDGFNHWLDGLRERFRRRDGNRAIGCGLNSGGSPLHCGRQWRRGEGTDRWDPGIIFGGVGSNGTEDHPGQCNQPGHQEVPDNRCNWWQGRFAARHHTPAPKRCCGHGPAARGFILGLAFRNRPEEVLPPQVPFLGYGSWLSAAADTLIAAL
jgi:hypothetical protein